MKRIAILLVISLGLLITSNRNKGKKPEETYTGNTDKAEAEDSETSYSLLDKSGDDENTIFHCTIIPWEEPTFLLDSNEPYRYKCTSNYSVSMYEKPLMSYRDMDKFRTGETRKGGEIEILDGVSLRDETKNEEELDYYRNYRTWLFASSNNNTGWIEYRDGSSMNVLARFSKKYSGIKQAPSESASVVYRKDTYTPNWSVGPIVEIGDVYEVGSRCGSWLCIGPAEGQTGWLPVNTPGLEFYRIGIRGDVLNDGDGWGLGFSIYFPVSDEIESLYYQVFSHNEQTEQEINKPKLKIVTNERSYVVDLDAIYHHGSGRDTYTEVYEGKLPHPIRKENIISMVFGASGYYGSEFAPRNSFTFDPVDIWGEPINEE